MSLVAESHTYVLVHVCEVSELAKALVAESHTHVLIHVCVVSELAFRAQACPARGVGSHGEL